MNKFKKVGYSALARSQAPMSAHPHDMSVSGGVNATYVSKEWRKHW